VGFKRSNIFAGCFVLEPVDKVATKSHNFNEMYSNNPALPSVKYLLDHTGFSVRTSKERAVSISLLVRLS